MPLGGVLGERIAKSISLYESQPNQIKTMTLAKTIAYESAGGDYT